MHMKKDAGHNIRLGVFVSLGIAVFIVGIYFIGEKQQLFRKTFRVSGVFKDVAGLQAGNNVRFSELTWGLWRISASPAIAPPGWKSSSGRHPEVHKKECGRRYRLGRTDGESRPHHNSRNRRTSGNRRQRYSWNSPAHQYGRHTHFVEDNH